MAIQTEPTRIQIPFADSGTKNVIPDTNSTPSASQAASWTDGFPVQCSLPLSAGGIPPARADFNGIFNTMTQSERFTQEGGVWTWASTVDYGTNRMVLGSNGKLYWSVAQSGPNVGGAHNPTTDAGTYWQLMPMKDSNVVHITGTETVSGAKTFTAQTVFEQFITVKDSVEACTNLRNTVLDLSNLTAEGNTYAAVNMYDKDNVLIAGATAFASTTRHDFRITNRPDANATNNGVVVRYWYGSQNYEFLPLSNGDINLGNANSKWKQVYASTATISTSDARLKTDPQEMPDEVLDAWGDVGFVQFQMLDAVAKKGDDSARLHTGLIAQRIEDAFSARGLDARRYGLFCWDEWDAEPEERDADGTVVREAQEAGDCYSLRYEEALCMEAAYQRRRADRAEARLAALEERLEAIEAKLLNS